MKVKIGDIVSSEFGRGPVVAMTKQWCIFADEEVEIAPDQPAEYALPWYQVVIEPEAGEVVSPLSEVEIGEVR